MTDDYRHDPALEQLERDLIAARAAQDAQWAETRRARGYEEPETRRVPVKE